MPSLMASFAEAGSSPMTLTLRQLSLQCLGDAVERASDADAGYEGVDLSVHLFIYLVARCEVCPPVGGVAELARPPDLGVAPLQVEALLPGDELDLGSCDAALGVEARDLHLVDLGAVALHDLDAFASHALGHVYLDVVAEARADEAEGCARVAR